MHQQALRFFCLFMLPLLSFTAQAESLKSEGSSTLGDLMHAWSEAFMEQTPAIEFSIGTQGSGAAPLALLENRVNFAVMSRAMTPKELRDFTRTEQYKPRRTRVALDTLTIAVNKQNPIKGLNEQQLDAIFSSDLKCGANTAITDWSQLGWESAAIKPLGHDKSSGTYGFFKERILCKGEHSDRVQAITSTPLLTVTLQNNTHAIGYIGSAHVSPEVRILPIAKNNSRNYMEPTDINALEGRYPLRRFLYVYTNTDENNKIDPLEKAFLQFVLSSKGQAIVSKVGFTALSEHITNKELKKL